MDEYHVATGCSQCRLVSLNGSTQLRATVALRRGIDRRPNAWDFYHVADDATQKDQDIFAERSIDNQTTAAFTECVATA